MWNCTDFFLVILIKIPSPIWWQSDGECVEKSLDVGWSSHLGQDSAVGRGMGEGFFLTWPLWELFYSHGYSLTFIKIFMVAKSICRIWIINGNIKVSFMVVFQIYKEMLPLLVCHHVWIKIICSKMWKYCQQDWIRIFVGTTQINSETFH